MGQGFLGFFALSNCFNFIWRNAILSSLNCLCTSAKNQLTKYMDFWLTNSASCVYFFTNVTLPQFSQFSSVTQSCPTLCDPMNCSTPGLPVHHQLPEFTQTYVHRVGDAIQSTHPVLSPSPPALNLSQHQGLLQWVGSLHQVAKVLEFQLQHQCFQWIFRIDFL